ncbi:hypothetical protein PHYPSEUDO_005197 [Phytophthora pseudosyringae]|uniref:Temptin Cys/Cys disulfide domain-containing protein n=1 Tax=Phytophthora pseudosyringae TaxID=221518 RepID=A0A8T1VLX9_9STRA|nr:hypothetical protein PHYPSEUDO_005197 [Phytophthora pseudosyringae]
MGVLRSRVVSMAAVCVAASLSTAPEAEAYKMFQQKLPNGANVPGVDAIGHAGPSGGPNNDFGLDFIEAMFRWTKAFCEKDSDGDGQTNGQELGDPCCEFVYRQSPTVRWTEGVSHPGNPKRKSDPKLWEGIVCGAAAAEPEAAEEKKEVQEEKEDTVVEAAVPAEAGTQRQGELTAGAPALHASVMLSAVALAVMAIYVVVRRTGRRTRNLPIFRQQRKGPM